MQSTSDFNISLFLESLLLLTNIEKPAKKFPTSVLDSLIHIVSLHNNPVDEDDAVLAARVVLKIIDQDVNYEYYLIDDKARLFKFFNVLLGLASSHRNDEDNPDISKVCLAMVGNISTHAAFGERVKISLQDQNFKLVFDLLTGSYVCLNNFSANDLEYYSLFKGIACLFIGNLATSLDKIQEILSQLPDIIPVAMKYFEKETDPFGLQGAQLIKNITASKLPYTDQVLKYNGVSLVTKLTGMKLFSNLRMLGAHIAKYLLAYSANLQNEDAIQGFITLSEALERVFSSEDSPEVKDEIILACDAAVAEVVMNKCIGREDEILTATISLTKIVIEYLHALYKTGGAVNVIVTLKASKTLGVLASALRPEPEKKVTILEHTIREDSVCSDKLVDILGKFSTQLAESKPTGDSIGEAMSKTYKGIINNLGYVGAKFRTQDMSDLAQASVIAVRNASN